MGYSEVPCKLCGVSFNIGRIRRPDESYRAGWSPICGEPAALPEDRNKGELRENFVSKDFVKWRRCDPSTGCQDVEREVASSDTNRKGSDGISLDCEDDDDYMSESEEDDESLDYTSEAASVEERDMGDAEGFTSEPDVTFMTKLDMAVDGDNTSVDADETNEVNDESTGGGDYQERGLSIDEDASGSGNSGSTDWGECQELEHLAGPRCGHASGYCGFNISAEEMRGCTTVQCLVVKTPEWTPEPDDQDFELSGKYYLSGLCGQMPSRDIGGPTMTPPRHGAKDIYPDTVLWNNSEADESYTPIPFHPTCFEIFTRASRLRTATIDVVGLMGWRILESDYETDCAFPRHEAVKGSREQEWHHQPGHEWLAANPVVVPRLAALLHLAVSEGNGTAKDAEHRRPVSEDPFSRFPREIVDAILELLSPVDVAALRLAGCARFLAIDTWYRLLREEMPWLWEVWDTVLPSFWATTTVSALYAEKKKKEKVERERLAARTVIQQEMPEVLEIWDMENAKVADSSYVVCGNEGSKETTVLPKDGTNWCRVYYEVKMNWEALKGLQNRERIWRDVEEIFRRIDGYRGEGRIA